MGSPFEKPAEKAAVAAAAVLVLAHRGYRLPWSRVKLRGVFWAANWLCRVVGIGTTCDVDGLTDLHEQALAAEHVAFGDDAAADAAKRSLFRIQLHGVDAPGNRFTPLGRSIFGRDLAKRLRRRIRLANAVAAAPKRAIDAPVVIVAGLPRTGSTLLHRLLCADAAARSPRYWEFMHDDAGEAVAGEDAVEDERRAAAVEAGFDKLAALSPNGLDEFKKFHHVDARAIEEVAGLLRRYVWDTETALLAPAAVAARARWFADDETDRSFLARHLASWVALQRLPKDRFWVLKSPALTAIVGEVADAFPDATIVFTSRDPARCVPSLCGLDEVACSVKFDYAGGLEAHGAAVLSRLELYAANQCAFVLAARGLHPALVLLRYDDLVADPIACVERIYAARGATPSEEARAAMERHLEENAQHKHGRAAYGLGQFGLDAADLGRRFAAYAEFWR